MSKKITIILLIFLLNYSITPLISYAQNDTIQRYSKGGLSLVRCDGVVTKQGEVPCDFGALINTTKFIINWLFVITIPIATVLFAYGGLLYLTGQDSKIKQAKAIFLSVAIGFIIMLIAWFAVTTIVNWFTESNSGANTLIGK